MRRPSRGRSPPARRDSAGLALRSQAWPTRPTSNSRADGRVFVAEKSGIIKVFASLTDESPTIFADLRTNVYNFWDRGLLGMALDPRFPTSPYVYVLYTYDAPIGGTAPTWGTPGFRRAVRRRRARRRRLRRQRPALAAQAPATDDGTEKVLIDDWFQQFPSHSVGTSCSARTARSTSAAATARASPAPTTVRRRPGQPVRRPAGRPAARAPPTAEGGALRARTPHVGRPDRLNGTIIRVDPGHRRGLSDNPMRQPGSNARRSSRTACATRSASRCVPHQRALGRRRRLDGVRGDQPDRRSTDRWSENFGWPCYEGPAPQPAYQSANLDCVRVLYAYAGRRHDAGVFAYSYNSGGRGRDVRPRQLVDSRPGLL